MKRAGVLGLVLALCACGGADEPAEVDLEAQGLCQSGQEEVLVIKALRFAREEPQGVSVGLDLDGRRSDAEDAAGCFQPDMIDPLGVEGVDNQFARLLPAVEAVGGEAIEELVKGAINSGELLLLLRLEHLDGWEQDGCVDMTVLRGAGAPLVGNDGQLEAGQTFDVDPSLPAAALRGLSLEGGALQGGPVTFSLPIQIFETSLTLTLRRSLIRIERAPDGQTRGFLTGALNVDEVTETARGIRGGGQIADFFGTVLGLYADLSPDAEGQCQELSVTLVFEAIPGWIYEDAPQPIELTE
jgi:hypothetical protein